MGDGFRGWKLPNWNAGKLPAVLKELQAASSLRGAAIQLANQTVPAGVQRLQHALAPVTAGLDPLSHCQFPSQTPIPLSMTRTVDQLRRNPFSVMHWRNPLGQSVYVSGD